MRIHAAGYGVAGTGRQKNDDHYCIGPSVAQSTLTSLQIDTTDPDFIRYGLLAAVADGMGGYAGGHTASRIALEVLSGLFYGESRAGISAEAWRDCMQRYLRQTQQTLIDNIAGKAELVQAGTTLAGIVLAAPDLLLVFHIGDSRVLRYSAGYVRPLTIDHTIIAADVASGRLTEAEAATMPNAGALRRSLGIQGTADADWLTEQAVIGTQYFIGTDGWHGLGRGLTRRQIQAMARDEQLDVVSTAQRMVHAAVASGSRDDTTLVVVQLMDNEDTDGR